MFTTMSGLDNYFGNLSILTGQKSRRQRKSRNQRGVSLQDRQDHNSLMQLSAKETEYFHAYRKAGDMVFAEICKILEAHSPTYKISRKIIAGSVGKRISLGLASQPDFDVVIFINNKQPPLEPVAEEFCRILKEFAPIKHPANIWTKFNKDELSVNLYFVTLSIDTKIMVEGKEVNVTISFDLQPASNLLPNKNIYSSSKSQVKIQTKAVLSLIANLPNPFEDWRQYSSSLAERTVQFTKNQREFVHDFIRLVKLWDGMIQIDDQWKIKGRSMLMELMAIKATYQSKSNMAVSFRKFLQMMIQFESLRVVFHYHYLCGQPTQIIDHHKPPMVIDAANPYDNLALGVGPVAMQILKKRAIDTLSALNDRSLFSGESLVGKYFAVTAVATGRQ